VATIFGIDLDRLTRPVIFDLSQGMRRGMPVSPNHPAFQMALLRRHGDMMRPDGGSAANEIIVTGGHVGTHIDALCHVSHCGMLHGEVEAAAVQSHQGFSVLGAETIDPVICRGILLDVPAARGVDVLPAGYEITPEDLDRAEERTGARIGAGDAVLVRSGWPAHWEDPDTFCGQRAGAPGPGEAGAEWLAERGIRVTGAETIAYEVIRPGEGHSVLPAHRVLLVEAGIHIIEVMNLDPLAAAGVSVFLFIVAPLRLIGATGSPVRPLALVDEV
jgi:kynurenine formamidase